MQIVKDVPQEVTVDIHEGRLAWIKNGSVLQFFTADQTLPPNAHVRFAFGGIIRPGKEYDLVEIGQFIFWTGWDEGNIIVAELYD